MDFKEEYYKIIFDSGKPFEVIVYNENDLKKELLNFYQDNKNNGFEYDCIILNKNGDDISETQLIKEIISDISEEKNLKELQEKTDNNINNLFGVKK